MLLITACSSNTTEETSNLITEDITKPSDALAKQMFEQKPSFDKSPETILDYYLQLPVKYLKGDKSSFKERQLAAEKKLLTLDESNAFLTTGNTEWENILSLYELSDGTDLLAVSNKLCKDGCCDSENYFLKHVKGGTWQDVTYDYLPTDLTFKTFCRDAYEQELLTDLAKRGSIALDLVYHLKSEKTPLYCSLNICFEPDYVPSTEEAAVLEIGDSFLALDWKKDVFNVDPSFLQADDLEELISLLDN